MKVILKTEVGKSITLNINPKDTFRDIKTRMVSNDGVPLDLFVNGMEVTDDQNVLDFFSTQQVEMVESDAEGEFDEAGVDKPAAAQVICSIRDCSNSKATHPDKAFFRFPTREDRRHHWLLVGRREDLLFAPAGSFRTQHAVCADHFTEDQFETPRELKNEAVPNLLLPRDDVLSIKQEPCGSAYEDDEEEEEEPPPSDLEDSDPIERSGRLCRLCATASDEMVYIFSAAGVELNLEQLINASLPVTVRRNDNLPKQLCMSCLTRLHAANALAEECLQAEEQLSLLVQLNFFRSADEPDDPEEPDVADVDSNICCPLCKEGGLCKVAAADLVEDKEAPPPTPDPLAPRACRLCGQLFRGREEGLEHAAYHATISGHPCPLCDEPVGSTMLMATHFDEAHFAGDDMAPPPRPAADRLRCSCSQVFDDEDALYSHRCFERETRRFSCRQCAKSFVSAARLEFHSCVNSGLTQQRTCLRCQRTFSCESSLYFHWRMAHDRDRQDEAAAAVQPSGRRKSELQCHACGQRFSRRAELREHVAREHPGASAKRVPSLINYHCRECQKTFTTSHQVVNHRVAHLQACEGHGCEYCPLQFDSVKTLSLHQKRAHADERPYICAVCAHTSRTLYEARSHRKGHMEALDWREMTSCPEDGGSMGRRVVTATRRRTHHECEFCGKRFADGQRLSVHRRLHTGEKPFACAACGKRFAQSSALHTHSLLHSGVKPHSCDLCGKAFRIKADRDNHRRTHTGEKPFKCEYCAKAFRTGQVYYQHRMIHTGERRFPCDICGLAFKRSHTLVVHKRIHTGEKPNVCDICNKGFRQRTDMRKHRALHGTHAVAAAVVIPPQDEQIDS